MKNYALPLALLLLVGPKLVCQNTLPPLAQEIASKDLAISNKDQFAQTLNHLIDQVKALLPQSIDMSTKRRGDRLYNRLNALIEVYANRYSVPSEILEETKNLLKEISKKFGLESPSPYIVPIAESYQPVSIGTSSIEEFFAFAQKDRSRPMTQTEAYLTKPMLKKILLESESFTAHRSPLSDNTGKYNILLARALEQERAHRDYYVVYHAQNKKFILFYDILKELIKLAAKKDRHAFEYVRVPDSEIYNKTLADLLQKGFEWDHDAKIARLLLSINFSLFGNAEVRGESSSSSFLLDKSVKPPGYLLHLIFDAFGLNPDFIGTFEKLFSDYAPSEGNLLQIFIPKNTINDYVYLSQAYGRLLSQQALVGTLKPPLQTVMIANPSGESHMHDLKTIDTRTYLEIYRNHPEELSFKDMDLIQGRLLITHDFLLNPESGVKIYRYNTMSDQRIADYKKQLESLVRQAVDNRERALLSRTTVSLADRALFKAIAADDPTVLQEVLDRGGIDFDAKNEYGKTALDVAQARGNKSTIELIEFYKGYSLKDDALMAHALYGAMEGFSESTARIIISKMPSINIRFSDGRTPLIEAIISNKRSLAQLLLDGGADVNFPNKYGETPLGLARKWRRRELVELLVDHGARS